MMPPSIRRVLGDPDEAEIYRHIGGDQSDVEKTVFRMRMRTDEQFLDKAAPLINFWRHGLDEPRGTVEQEALRLEVARERLWQRGREVMGLPPKPYDASVMTALLPGEEETRATETLSRRALAVGKWLLPRGVLTLLLASLAAAISVLVARHVPIVLFQPALWVGALESMWVVVLLVPLVAVATGLPHAWWLFTPARWLTSFRLANLLHTALAIHPAGWRPVWSAVLWSAHVVEFLVPLILLYSPEIRLLTPWAAVAWNPARALSRLSAAQEIGGREWIRANLEVLIDPLWIALLLAFYAPNLLHLIAAARGVAPWLRLPVAIPWMMAELFVARTCVWASFPLTTRLTARIPSSPLLTGVVRTASALAVGYGLLRFAL